MSRLRTSLEALRMETGPQRISNLARYKRMCKKCARNKVEHRWHLFVDSTRLDVQSHLLWGKMGQLVLRPTNWWTVCLLKILVRMTSLRTNFMLAIRFNPRTLKYEIWFLYMHLCNYLQGLYVVWFWEARAAFTHSIPITTELKFRMYFGNVFVYALGYKMPRFFWK